MILILSTDDDDSTDEVVRWLLQFNVDFIRISEKSKIILNSLTLSNTCVDFTLEIDNSFAKKTVKYSEISSYWYRRSDLNLDDLNFSIKDEPNLTYNVKRMLQYELKDVRDYIFYLFSKKKHINHYQDNFINKQIFLDKCLEKGLKIPDTFISSKQNNILKFCDEQGEAITKAIAIGYAYKYLKTPYHPYIMTELIDANSIKANLPKTFFPSLAQKNINKLFEIRSFYLDGVFYSSAIFSQSNDKTKIDFRNYDEETPNRVVPYSLPIEIETSLDIVMKELNINSGSFDIIYGQDHEYYVLEVNPIGRFWQVSTPCNYNLEKIIAKYLSSNEI